MNKAGGIISIIAGIFGVIAAITTLFVGGMGSAFDANGASQVIGFGWGGILFSFLVIVFGAMAFGKPKFSGYAIIVSSLFGAFLGGTFVAVCMALSIIGGILALFGKNDKTSKNIPEQIVEATGKKKTPWVAICSLVIVAIIALANIGENDNNKVPAIDPLAELKKEPVSDLSPHGELASMFAFGSNNTDLQRENKLKEITGKVVQWQLQVYDVKRSGNGYKVQTQTNLAMFMPNVGTFISITPRNDEEKQVIEALKTGDTISFKGKITDSTMRHLEIKPAILVLPGAIMQQTTQAETIEPKQQEQSVVTEVQPIPDPEPIEPQVEEQQPVEKTQAQQENAELSRYKAKDALDEANKQINVTWNGTTKDIRAAILPEQREWIKEREGICTLKASTQESDNTIVQDTIKLNCMTAMTNQRTDELKQKIASFARQ
jgi:uncharacterized protein YecT (DUF1311 family)